jgi:hypothetical protein
MADMVDRSGLILTDWADAQAKAQAAAYAQVQRARESETYQKAQALEAASNAAKQQYAGGNYEAARQTAAAGNAWDVWSGIDKEQKAQVAAQASDIGTAAFNLAKLPKGQSRLDYFNSFVPTLKSHGMSDAEIQQYAHSGFLDNDDALSGYRDKAIGIKELYDTEQATIKGQQEHDYKMAEIGAGITSSADGTLVRNGDGSVVHGAGIKPELVEYKDAKGNTHIVPYGGQPGATPAPGATGNRTMGWTPRGVDNNSNASVDNKIGIIANSVGAAPDAPLTQQQFLSLNMTALEGKPAGRHNYGNMKNTDGSWKQFDSPEQYQAAQRAWLNRRWNEGARTIRDAVEGRQVGGGRSAAAAPSGGTQDINLGGGREGALWVDKRRDMGNGTVVLGQENQETGEFKPYPGANRATKPATQEEQMAAGYARRMDQANTEMQNLYNEGYKAHSKDADWENRKGGIPVVGNYLMSSQAQRQKQAELNFLTAILRKESGASISPTEFKTGEANYFPRPGDSPDVLAQKARARSTAIQSIRAAGGSASKPQQAARAPAGAPQAGTVRNGYRFKGGNPNDRNNWTRI